MKIKIILESCYSKGWPKVEIKINDSILYDDICKPEEKYFILAFFMIWRSISWA